MSKKGNLINSILQVNAISRMTNSDRLPKDKRKQVSQEGLFISLAFLTEEELIKICSELNIKV